MSATPTVQPKRYQARIGRPRQAALFRLDKALLLRLKALAVERKTTVTAIAAAALAKEVGMPTP